jgi:branched-chain amino acid transport system substrate-binding protein
MKRPFGLLMATVLMGSLAVGCTTSKPVLEIGAVYPLTGAASPGAIDEHRGALLAAELVNRAGGVDGRQIQVESVDTPTSDVATGAVDELAARGVKIVLGSYLSTISGPASTEAAKRGLLFWETGAVGMLPASSELGSLTFRVPPTGEVLGRAAITFIADQIAPKLHRDPRSLRFAISYVNDVYGRSVQGGAESAMRSLGLHSVGSFGYDYSNVDMARLVTRIKAAKPDILFVSSYLPDAIALRRQLVKQHVALLANIGTSSSYCMPAFGDTLGKDAVGVYASDKPSASSINPAGLPPQTRALLAQANTVYESHYGIGMSPPALAGFSAGWALFHDVLPAASSLTPDAIATAARGFDLPKGSLPNGSGLHFGAVGTPDAGDNLAAASVIWKWVSPGHAAVIWPRSFATTPIDPSTSSAW